MTTYTTAELEASRNRLETDLALDRELLAEIRRDADVLHNEEDYPGRGEAIDEPKVVAYEISNRIAHNEETLARTRTALAIRAKEQDAHERRCAHVARSFENHIDD